MSHDEKQIVIKTKYVKYGCITMAIILLIAAIGTGIWLYQQLDASHKFWRETMNDLKAQDIMKTSWPGIELLATEETKDVGFEPELPRITNCYRLTISDEEARQLVLSTAVKDGWIENPTTDSSYSRSGFKRLDSRSINLTISEKRSDCKKYPEASFQVTVYY